MAATSTTPATGPHTHQRHPSRSGNHPSRPTTPLRPPSRTSLRASQTTPSGTNASLPDFPLATLEPAFAELSDSMADLEANFMHLQLLHESLGRFNENFGAFLYGMNMSAICVDFPEAPIPQSFARHKYEATTNPLGNAPSYSSNRYDNPAPPQGDVDATFLTTDTSFVDNPPTSSKPASRYSAPTSAATSRQSMAPGRGGAARGRGATPAGRGASRGVGGPGRAGSGIGRGVARGRGGNGPVR
ncbi:DASH complex subunit dam1 [Teratosphaeriaceae sp. CCFEE 6253]|nr:DASH complex subunit dam1 [Teratosphaeriaceae sp. CCFEE 6253]